MAVPRLAVPGAWLYAAFAAFAAGTAAVTALGPHRVWGWCAAVAYGVGALAAWRTRRRDRVAAWVAAGAVLVPLAFLVGSGQAQPEVDVVHRAGELLLENGSPYLSAAELAGRADYEAYNPYLPGMALFGLPWAVAGIDARLVFGAVLAVALVASVRRSRSLLLLAGSPLVALPLTVGGDDLPVIGLSCLGLALAAKDRVLAAGLVLGLAATLKATAFPAVAVALALVLARRRATSHPAGRDALVRGEVGGPAAVRPERHLAERGVAPGVASRPVGCHVFMRGEADGPAAMRPEQHFAERGVALEAASSPAGRHVFVHGEVGDPAAMRPERHFAERGVALGVASRPAGRDAFVCGEVGGPAAMRTERRFAERGVALEQGAAHGAAVETSESSPERAVTRIGEARRRAERGVALEADTAHGAAVETSECAVTRIGAPRRHAGRGVAAACGGAVGWFLGAVAAVFVVGVVPVAVGDPGGFLQNVVRFPLGLAGVESPAASPLPGRLLADLGSYGHLAAVVALVLAAVGVAVSLVVRPPGDLRAAAVRLAVGLGLATLLMPATRWGYLIYPAVFLGWARVAGERRPAVVVAPRREEAPAWRAA